MDQETREFVGRLEAKVDGIIQSLDRLSRIEERYLNQTSQIARHEQTLNNHNDRIRQVEISTGRQTVTISGNGRMIWAIIGGIGAFLLQIISQYLTQ